MTAKGKINAASVQANDRIIVAPSLLTEGRVNISQTKTGEGVQIARVIAKTFRAAQGPYEAQGKYVIETTAGSFEAAPIQTMWLAPKDAAGIKRAHAEALIEDVRREVVSEVMDKYHAEAELEDAERAAGDPRQWATEGTEYPYRGEDTHRVELAEDFTPAEREELAEDFRTSGALDDAHAEALAARALLEEVASASNKSSDPTVTGDMTGSAVVELMEMVWDRIRQNHPQLPAVVIVTGSGMVGSSKWGHFRRDGWKIKTNAEGAATSGNLDEMFMAGETLAKGARQVLQTMLHEGAHTLAKVREVQDTSRQGRWHNAKFRSLAEEMGLEHKAAAADKSIGFSFVTLTAQTIEKYADLLTELDAAIRLVVHLPGWLGGDEDDKGGELIGKKPPTTEPSTGSLKLVCRCEEPNIIRASRKVADKLVVKCDDCDEMFGEASN